MTAPKAAPLFTQTTKLVGGAAKLFQVIEDLRTLNSDGYLPGSTLLSWVQGTPFAKITTGVVCSPFTANAIAGAFDPNYSADLGKTKDNPLKPMFNGGSDPLPFAGFYHLHNGNYPIQSIVNYGLGEALKSNKQMRKGDYVAIDWAGGGGHSVFCWDVHVNSKGDVDCFLMIGSNGTIKPVSGYGVTVYGCVGKTWFSGTPAGGNGAGKGNLTKVNPPVFVDSAAITTTGYWLALPGVTKADIDPAFLKLGAKIFYGKFAQLQCARFFSDTPPPDPYSNTLVAGGAAPAATGDAAAAPPKDPPGHMDVASTPVPAASLASDPNAAKSVQPKPAAQDPQKPLASQQQVEQALQEFYAAKWITTDPGSADNINDAQSQAAIKEFQGKFGLDADGIAGPKTKAMMALQLPACTMQLTVQAILGVLKAAGLIQSDPGPVDPTNNDAMQAAVKEFQKLVGLDPTGIPDAATQAKLQEKVASSAPSSDQHGLVPALTALYWMGNGVAPGGTATLRLASVDVMRGQEFQVFIKDTVSGKEVDAGVKLSVTADTSEAQLAIPDSFGLGSTLFARVTATLDGGKKLELSCAAPLYVRAANATSAASTNLEVFFKYGGWIGPAYNASGNATSDEKHAAWQKNKAYTYVGYRVPGKTSWFVRGRGNVDIDGAPNTYHPTNKNVVRAGEFPTYDVMRLDRPLDSLADGPSGLQSKDGKLYIQTDSDPAPGYYVMATLLKRPGFQNWDPRRYADARVIPFWAIPLQVLQQKNTPSSVDNFTGFQAVGTGHSGNTGDYVTAINLNPRQYKGEPSYPPDYLDLIEINGKKYPIGHGIVGDTGNQPHIGECSYAFAKMLHTLDGPEYADVLWMVHPGSGKGANTIPEPADIKSEGQRLFDAWGGQAQLAAVLARDELKSSGR